MSDILSQLGGGDRRSIGRSNLVVRRVLADPRKFGDIIQGLSADDLLVRMRCADVAEKVSVIHAEWLQPYKRLLLDFASHATQQELRWHLAQMLPRLKLSSKERRAAVATMFEYLNDKSRIVKTFSMQALADFANDDSRLRGQLLPLFESVERTGSPAMRARARRLVVRLRKLKGANTR